MPERKVETSCWTIVVAHEIRGTYGAKVYAQKELCDILENPRAYFMPALSQASTHVDYPLSEGEVFSWKGYKMTAYYYPSQTIYHDGLLVEHEGAKVFMAHRQHACENLR